MCANDGGGGRRVTVDGARESTERALSTVYRPSAMGRRVTVDGGRSVDSRSPSTVYCLPPTPCYTVNRDLRSGGISGQAFFARPKMRYRMRAMKS